MDSIHLGLLRKYHTLCTQLGMTNDEKHALLEGYGVESSRDLDHHDIIDLCARLSRQLEGRRGKQPSTDRLRKRCMAAIGGWLRMTGREESADYIKSIACRATGYEEFNRIPRQRLVNLAAAFANRQKDEAAAERIMKETRQPSFHSCAVCGEA